MTSPPRWALWLLRIGCPPGRRADVEGDLYELHAARRTRWGPALAWWISSIDTLRVVLAFSAHSLHRAIAEGRGALSLPDLRLSLRQLRKHPFLNLTSALALAVGVGFANAGFALMGGVAFPSLPFADGDRFVRIEALDRASGARIPIRVELFQALREDARSLEFLGAKDHEELNLFLPSGEVDRVTAVLMSPEAFELLPAQPILGRVLQPEDGSAGAPPVVVIRESLWTSRLGGGEDILGTTIDISGTGRTVVGVLPDGFEFPNSPLLWVPLDQSTLGGVEGWAGAGIELFGVLREGVAVEAAASEIAARVEAFEQATGGASPLFTRVLGYVDVANKGELWALLGAFVTILVLVLLVIASNVGSLFLARTTLRSSELAVRASLGASRARLIGQLFAEMLVIVAVAAAVGLAASGRVLRWFRSTLDEAPFWMEFEASTLSVVAAIGAIVLVTTTAGLLPALRSVSRDPAGSLRGNTRGSSPARVGVLGSSLAVLEMTLSVALVGAALATGRSALRYAAPAPVIPYERIITAEVRIELPTPREPVPDLRAWQSDSLLLLRDAVIEAIRTAPGVVAAGAATDLPGQDPSSARIEVEGLGPRARLTSVVAALPGYHDALGAPPIEGRGLASSDHQTGAVPVAVVNQAFVRDVLQGRSPIGRRLRAITDEAAGEAPAEWREIVGVVPDLALGVANPEREAGYYVPMGDQRIFELAVLVTGNPSDFAATLIRSAGAVDPRVTVRRIIPLDQVPSEESFALLVFGGGAMILGGFALALSLLGMFVITSLEVSRRTREIGIRAALGAPRGSVVMLLTRNTLQKLLLGAAAGGVLGWLVLRVVGALSPGLGEGSPWTFLPLALILVGSGALASWVPARRALSIPASEALAAE